MKESDPDKNQSAEGHAGLLVAKHAPAFIIGLAQRAVRAAEEGWLSPV